MPDNKKSIFRQKSLERIASPEQLDQYLQVTRLSTWIVLGAIVVLLVGFCVWGFFGHLTTSTVAAVYSQDNQTVCLIPEEEYGKLKADSNVTVAGQTYDLVDPGMAPMFVDDSISDNIKLAGKLLNGMVVRILNVDGQLPEGVYVGQIQIESVTPMSFILN